MADGTADQLARLVTRDAHVRWRRDGQAFSRATPDAVAFVRELLNDNGDEITDLDVRRATLEDTYLAMVQRFESGDRD